MNPAEPAQHDGHATIPHLRKQGSATQLVVDGRPFLVRGGELHNSSASSLEYLRPFWERLLSLNLNTVLAPVYWELLEPREGAFDFSLVDGLIREARRHDLRLILLWFGSWKNGMSSYVPGWVKRDYRRFPRARLADGRSVEVLSTLSDANLQADADAFVALMRHLRAVDGAEHTVLMVQVENEVGILGDSRDRSDAANAALSAPVPPELLDWLQGHGNDLAPELAARWAASGQRTSGSWSEVFGEVSGNNAEADEIFMAWRYATYVDRVAAAGKAEYPLPMFVNAWLSNPYQKPGDWPSGGPLPRVHDLWRVGAPHVDMIAPDIYQSNFQEWCQRYAERGNPLFIPEMRRGEDGARGVFLAVGQYDAIGTSPFAVDSIESPETSPFARIHAALRQVAPLVLEHQGKGKMVGFLLDAEHPSARRELGGYELEIMLDGEGWGLIVAEGDDSFVGVGSGFRVGFHQHAGAAGASSAARVGIVAVDEGEYRAGRWVPGRRLNGDETAQGQWWRFPDQRITVERCAVYRYE